MKIEINEYECGDDYIDSYYDFLILGVGTTIS
jgi:hypothetical protein